MKKLDSELQLSNISNSAMEGETEMKGLVETGNHFQYRVKIK